MLNLTPGLTGKIKFKDSHKIKVSRQKRPARNKRMKRSKQFKKMKHKGSKRVINKTGSQRRILLEKNKFTKEELYPIKPKLSRHQTTRRTN
jgi:hypothetical protein